MESEPVATSRAMTKMRGTFGASLWVRLNTDAKLGLLALAVFVANLAISFLIQGDGIWQSDRSRGYLMHLVMALIGVHYWAPVGILLAPLVTSQEAGYYHGWPWFALAMTAMVLVAQRATAIPLWRRALWAHLIAAQLAGFAAVHWSTIGN